MPVVTFALETVGPIVRLAVGTSEPRMEALRAAGLNVPRPVIVRGLIDTGASCTEVDREIITRLGLQPTGATSIRTPSTGTTPHPCDQYDVALGIAMPPDLHVASLNLPVVEMQCLDEEIKVLLGRDVLSNGIFIYDGRGGHFSLAF